MSSFHTGLNLGRQRATACVLRRDWQGFTLVRAGSNECADSRFLPEFVAVTIRGRNRLVALTCDRHSLRFLCRFSGRARSLRAAVCAGFVFACVAESLMQVLIVDDNPTALELLEHTLKRSGYEVLMADNGKTALEILERGNCQLVITDWEMPQMSGLELCRHIRSACFMNYIYIILLTARREASDSIEGMSAGADDFIVKPFQPSELTLRVLAG
jgi:CheY-like chemotaxis protein